MIAFQMSTLLSLRICVILSSIGQMMQSFVMASIEILSFCTGLQP